MTTPHLRSVRSVRLAPTWHQGRRASARLAQMRACLPLIADQRTSSKCLVRRLFSLLVPTWCHA